MVLVVDDDVATGSTMEAISAAIMAALPAASVVGFVPGRRGVCRRAPECSTLRAERVPGQVVDAFGGWQSGSFDTQAGIDVIRSSSGSEAIRAAEGRRGNLKLTSVDLCLLWLWGSGSASLSRNNWQRIWHRWNFPAIVECECPERQAGFAAGTSVERKNMPQRYSSQRWARGKPSLSSQTWRGAVEAGGLVVENIPQPQVLIGFGFTKSGKVGWVIASAVKETGPVRYGRSFSYTTCLDAKRFELTAPHPGCWHRWQPSRQDGRNERKLLRRNT
jgi:hypothetical protein